MWRYAAISTGLLLCPLALLYLGESDSTPIPTVTEQPHHRFVAVSVEAPLLDETVPKSKALPTRILPRADQTHEGRLFHLCEEKGQIVYKIRVTESGDELTVCAQTGKLLAVGNKWTGQPLDPMKKS